MHVELDGGEFDETFDVVVAGYGFGGGIAAIEAARRGASVLVCEKMPQPGGVSICSGGGVRCALDADDAFSYLKVTNAGTTPDDVLRVLADGMACAEAYVKQLSSEVEGTSVKTTEFSGRAGGNYPFPGWKTFFTAQIEVPPTFDRQALFPSVRTRPSSGGPGLFWVIDNHVRRLGVPVRLNTRVRSLIRSAETEIRGVVITGAVGIPLLLARHPDWLTQGHATIIYQAALKRSPYFPNVPTLPELGLTDDGRAVLRAIPSTAEIGRSIITTPDVPIERLAALRQAFQKMLKDPDFIESCKRRHIMLDPDTGEDMDAIVTEIESLPKPITAELGTLLRQ